MRIALTGASGFIGSVIARRAAESGHQITALVRESSRRDHIQDAVDRFVVGDQADESVWGALLDDADAVIHGSLDWPSLRDGDLDQHLAGNLLSPIRMLDRARPRPFVFLSTIAVHHEMLDRWAGEIDESHPTRPGSLYGAAKASVETHLFAEKASHDRRVCALRPCAVYGMDPNQSRSIGWPIVERIRSGERYERAGGGKFVHVDDVAAAALGVLTWPIEKEDSLPNVVNLADCYLRWADWADIIADELGVEVDVDRSSPAAARNMFTKDAARVLGVELNRGRDGIRQHVRQMIAAGA